MPVMRTVVAVTAAPEDAVPALPTTTQSPTLMSENAPRTCWVNEVFAFQVTATWPEA